MKLTVLSVSRLQPQTPEQLEHNIQNNLNYTDIKIDLDGNESWSELSKKRLEVCLKPCIHLTHGKFLTFTMEVLKCGVCGCAVKPKVRIPNARCPKSFW